VPSLALLTEGCVFRPRCPYAFERCVEPPPLYPATDRTAVADQRHAARCHLLDHG
jgi:ABC-type antimicrobial peptide transport system ATPase subunit